jgi:uncharacterized protein YceH (UPF0502 family)
MELVLDPIEIRILGSLIEKELATPEYYPLSLNALTNACNQKNNRDPVVDYDEAIVESAAGRLIEKGVVWKSSVGRVPKYEERFTHERSLVPREASVLCLLLLRGPQTIGEIRGRATRLHEFKDLEQVQAALGDLSEWGLACQLPRVPGHKECRYAHLLAGVVEAAAASSTASQITPQAAADDGRLEKIEADIESLRKEIEDLKTAFAVFKKQFE